MDVRLKVLEGKHAGKEIPVSTPKFMIGRGEDCQLRAGSDLISRHHCQITVGDSTILVKDCGSRNGTFVNDEQINDEVVVNAGDRLRVGPLDFELVSKHAIGGRKRPAVKDVADVAARTVESKKPVTVEDSISDWLGVPISPSSPSATIDTRALKVADTEEIERAATEAQDDGASAAEAPNGDADDDGGADNDGADENGKKKEPGKLPKVDQPRAKDSREAAAQILKQMAMRRR